LMQDPWVTAHGLSLTREHDAMGLDVCFVNPVPVHFVLAKV
jgi:hypothetical protein